MTGLHFVDSNILVYRHDQDDKAKQARAQQILTTLWRDRRGRVSDQVLHEFYVVSTKKLPRPLEPSVARQEVRQLLAWQPIKTTQHVRERAWHLEDRYAVAWWDALIIAAAQTAGCSVLLSDDLQDGQQFDDLTVINPLVRDLAL